LKDFLIGCDLLLKFKTYFGIDIGTVCERDQVTVPLVVAKCVQIIDQVGLRTPGLYRVTTSHSAIQKLKNALDKGFIFLNTYIFFLYTYVMLLS
jgi:hypothetical protein